MTYYARVVFETNASVAERHDDVNTARGWIEAEMNASPESFRLGQIFEGAQIRKIVATCDRQGWHWSSGSESRRKFERGTCQGR